MSQVLINEISRIKKQTLRLGAQVESSLILAAKALRERNAALAHQVESSDGEIDSAEVSIEEEVLKILALHQPVAVDLRFLTSVMKINADLERIGDLAANVAKRVIKMSDFPDAPVPDELFQMANAGREMVRDSLNAFVGLDEKLAAAVHSRDSEVDELCRWMFEFIETAGRAAPEPLRFYLQLLAAPRDLERIGDHATNIAEDVLYLIRGIIMRHRMNLETGEESSTL